MTQTIRINGPIDDPVLQRVQADLALMDRAQPLLVEINSDGGSVHVGTALYTLIGSWPGGVTTECTGWCLSIATAVMMAGTTRRMHPAGLLMVHAPWMSAGGNAEELRQHADTLDKVADAMVAAYRRTGQPEAVIRGWLAGNDHWFTADEALAVGLASEVIAEAAPTEFANAAATRHHPPAEVTRKVFAMSTTTAPNAAAILAADKQRREAIRAKLSPWAGRMDATAHAALLRACEDDTNCTPQAAGDKLLALMAKDAGPIQGSMGWGFYAGQDRVAEFKAAAVDALLIRAGAPVKDPHPAARDLQRLDICGMAERVLSMTGTTARNQSRDGIISAALSTSDFANLLAGTVNKSLSLGYMVAASGHTEWSGSREVPDFKTATLVNVSEAPALLKVPELTEFQHGTLTESASTFRVESFGRIVRLSRQMLINDDLQALGRLPLAMGQAARRLEADMVYAALTSTANLSDGLPLFNVATRGNLASAGAALSLTALGAARAAMRRQKNIGGTQYIDPQPRFLIVPVALETQAEVLIASLVDPARSNDTPNAEWVRALTVIADPRLDETSTTAWYLAASPAMMDGIIRAYLSGQTGPYLEQNTEFIVDAISWKVRMDLAAGVVEWRSLYKNPGA